MTADNPRAGYVRRVYSSDEAAYPTLGTKPIVFDENYRKMTRPRGFRGQLRRRDAGRFSGSGFDHVFGLRLCREHSDRCRWGNAGLRRLLHEEGWFTPARVKVADALIVPAMACFLILRARFETPVRLHPSTSGSDGGDLVRDCHLDVSDASGARWPLRIRQDDGTRFRQRWMPSSTSISRSGCNISTTSRALPRSTSVPRSSIRE